MRNLIICESCISKQVLIFYRQLFVRAEHKMFTVIEKIKERVRETKSKHLDLLSKKAKKEISIVTPTDDDNIEY